MLLVAAVTYFFRFFGEITIPMPSSFNSSNHLFWGDVAIYNKDHPQVLKVYLKKSKVHQLGKCVDMYIGKTNCYLCPVTVAM